MGINNQNDPLAWDDLRFFLALVRAGSLMAAARGLGVEHSTVSRRVGGLETTLGLRLFDRLPRGWRPTPEGARLVAQAEAVEREVATLSRTAAGLDALTGEVRISAPPVLLAMLVAPGLTTLRQTHPGLVPILIGARQTSDLDRAEADIALRMGAVVGPDLITRRLGSLAYGLYGRPDQIALPPARRVYLGFDDSLPDLPQAHWLDVRTQAETASIGLRSNDMATLMASARAGLGLALLPRFAARALPDLMELPDENPFDPRPLFLVMHPDIRRSARVRQVADHLNGFIGKELDRLG